MDSQMGSIRRYTTEEDAIHPIEDLDRPGSWLLWDNDWDEEVDPGVRYGGLNEATAAAWELIAERYDHDAESEAQAVAWGAERSEVPTEKSSPAGW